ncbi:MAG: peptidase S1 [Terricaulis sp.]
MSTLARILASTALLALVASPVVAQDFSLAPNYGTIELTAGFEPDPHVVDVSSGGTIDAETRDPSCKGFITEAPDLRVNYTAGTGLPLIISVHSAADTTLVVNGPDASWVCDDDGGVLGLNPSVVFTEPASGQYDIWVGTYGSATIEPSRLALSELYSQ